jgi:hypothetical protein
MTEVIKLETQELPSPIVIDLMHELQRKVHDQIMLNARIADHPKDMFRILSIGKPRHDRSTILGRLRHSEVKEHGPRYRAGDPGDRRKG